MHVQIFDILVVWLFIVMSTEPRKTLITDISFDWIHSSNQHIETAVELLLVEDKGIVDVPLSQVLMVEGRLG